MTVRGLRHLQRAPRASLVAGALTVLVVLTTACVSGTPAGNLIPLTTRPLAGLGAGDELRVGSAPGLARVVVDAQGLTVYVFEPDARSGRSRCFGLCAGAWPPLILSAGVARAAAGRGVSGSLIGTTVRAPGKVQVTYNGWPLYTWPGDTRPGQATGQGLNNVGGRWYVIGPSGKVIT